MENDIKSNLQSLLSTWWSSPQWVPNIWEISQAGLEEQQVVWPLWVGKNIFPDYNSNILRERESL